MFELDEFFGNAKNHSNVDVIDERFNLFILSAGMLYDLLEITNLLDGIALPHQLRSCSACSAPQSQISPWAKI